MVCRSRFSEFCSDPTPFLMLHSAARTDVAPACPSPGRTHRATARCRRPGPKGCLPYDAVASPCHAAARNGRLIGAQCHSVHGTGVAKGRRCSLLVTPDGGFAGMHQKGRDLGGGPSSG